MGENINVYKIKNVKINILFSFITVISLIIAQGPCILFSQTSESKGFIRTICPEKEALSSDIWMDFQKTTGAQYSENMSLVGRWSEDGGCGALIIDDDLLYFLNGIFFEIADISDPAEPEVLSKTLLPHKAYEIEIKDKTAYLAAGRDGLLVYDVNDPENPVKVTSYSSDWNAQSLYLIGNLIFVDTFESGVRILKSDASRNLIETGSLDINVMTICGNNDLICMVKYDSLIFGTVNNQGFLRINSVFQQNRTYNAFISDNYVYSNTHHGFEIVDISDPVNPYNVGSLSYDNHYNAIHVSDDHAYISNGLRILIVDISIPSSPAKLSEIKYDNGGGAYDESIFYYKDHVYLSTGEEMYIYDVSNPLNPLKAGSFYEESLSRSMAVSGDYAILSYSKGITIIDASDPANPVKISELKHEGIYTAQGCQSYGNFLYRFHYNGLIIIDIGDPYQPFETSRYDYSSYDDHFHTSCVNDKYLFISWCFSRRILIMDITDPYDPLEVSVIEDPDAGRGLFATSNYLYFDRGGDFTIYDISDISNPVEVGNCESTGLARGLYVKGNYAYKTRSKTFQVFDISDPYSPFFIKEIEIDNTSYVLDVDGNYAYITGIGVQVVDISDPASPVKVGKYYNGSSFGAIKVTDGLIFAEDYGLTILKFVPGITNIEPDVNSVKNYILYNNYPNPFNPETSIGFLLKAPTNVSLKIYSITGKQVKTLCSGRMEPRTYNFTWDGTNERGQNVGSGVYLYRLQVGNFSQTKKMLQIK